MKRLFVLMCLLMMAGIIFAQVPAAPEWVSFTRDSPTSGTIRWSANPSAFVSLYYLSLQSDEHNYNLPAFHEPPWNISGTYGLPGYDAPLAGYVDVPGVYKQVIPNGLDPAKEYIAYVAAVNAGWQWVGAGTSYGYVVPLPVELSNFSAALCASNYVSLSWTSQSETNLLGYRVYRSESASITDAVMITPTMIQATNTSTACTYTHDDYEVQQDNTYWYWLESVDYNGGTMHGPAAVSIGGGDPNTPVVPVHTTMSDVYPNPFRISGTASAEIGVKAGETATLTIYNLRGQIIKVSQFSEGNHIMTWNGLDNRGKLCPGGMYLFRLNSASYTKTTKLVLIP